MDSSSPTPPLDSSSSPAQAPSVPPIELTVPLSESQTPGEHDTVLIASDQQTKFVVNTRAFKFYSRFAEGVLSGGEEGEEIPLDSDRASPKQLQRFATWLKHHETIPVSKIPIPLPRLMAIDDYFTDPWDLAFIRQHIVGEDEDMTKVRDLYGLALLSTYLQCEPLTMMLCCFLGWHIKQVAAVADEPEKEIARWTRHSPEFTEEEMTNSLEWCRSVLKGVPVPERRTMESDDEQFGTPPCATAAV